MNYSVKNFLLFSWRQTQGHRRAVICLILLLTVAWGSLLALPWTIAYIIDGFSQAKSASDAWNAALWGTSGYFVLMVFGKTVHHIARYLQLRVAFFARLSTLRELIMPILRQDYQWHTSFHTGDIIARLERSGAAVEYGVGGFLWQMVEHSVKIVGAFIILFSLQGSTAALLFLGVALTGVVMVLLNRRAMVALGGRYSFFNDLTSRISDVFTGILTVKAFRAETGFLRYIFEKQREGEQAVSSYAVRNEVKWGVIDLLQPLVVCGAILVMLNAKINTGDFSSVGEIYVLMDYCSSLFSTVWALTTHYTRLLEESVAFASGSDLVPHSDDSTTKAKSSGEGTVELRDLRVRRGSYEFDFPSLSVEKGQTVAIIGESGGGKSTLLYAIAGLVTCESGTEHIPQDSLYVPQFPELFSASLRFNLELGQSWSDSELCNALNTAGLVDWLRASSDGLDTQIVRGGVNLSGGQKQRIGLARALLRKDSHSIFLLDEPTSALDPILETEVLTNVLNALQGKTILCATHRRSVLPLFQRIIEVGQGEVISDSKI
jgi:ATP-binding cassette, subfamily B, bacterial